MKLFPFPDKENSMQELENDYVFSKIMPEEVTVIFQDAWDIGETQAHYFLKHYAMEKPIDMIQVLKEKKVDIRYKDMDYVAGKTRYFCEYFSGQNYLNVYCKSVALWCESNELKYEEGLNVILCHEYFHYLESYEIGMISRRHLVHILKIGKWKWGKTGIPSLSEIAANAFTNLCYKHLIMEENYDL